jgi:hypothetical protein
MRVAETCSLATRRGSTNLRGGVRAGRLARAEEKEKTPPPAAARAWPGGGTRFRRCRRRRGNHDKLNQPLRGSSGPRKAAPPQTLSANEGSQSRSPPTVAGSVVFKGRFFTYVVRESVLVLDGQGRLHRNEPTTLPDQYRRPKRSIVAPLADLPQHARHVAVELVARRARLRGRVTLRRLVRVAVRVTV